MTGPVTPSGWVRLRGLTPARIALGRAGTSLPTAPHLEFQLAHARARKAVHLALDSQDLARGLTEFGKPILQLHSAAADRATYLQRPDLGRQLDGPSRDLLTGARGCDLALVIGDGLSATAIHTNALPFLRVVMPALHDWRIGPICVVRQARVAIGDQIGAALGAQMVVMLIGERPGLSSPDSMGLYLTHAPRAGLTDEARNCISNIRAAGLSHAEAAHKLVFLMTEARRRSLSGVALKDEAEALSDARPRRNFLLD